jgi:glycosyltransferase involved in cell wall biosynthesis
LKIIFSKNKADYIYINGLFSLKYSIFPGIIASLLRPKAKVIFAIRGEASDAAMLISSTKKKYFLRLLRVFSLYRSFSCQASSVYEQEDVFRNFYGIFKQVFVVQDAISRPIADFEIKKLGSPVKILFVGRIAPIKNLDFALESLRGLPMEVDFDLYGIVEDNEYWDRCQTIISSMPLNISVKHFGPLSKDSLLNVLPDYDLLLFPSKSENFGHVIYECLSEGIPVLIGDRTPWRDLVALGVGWDLPLVNPLDFTKVMVTFFSLSDEERNSYRRRAMNFACRTYERIGRNESLKLFTW